MGSNIIQIYKFANVFIHQYRVNFMDLKLRAIKVPPKKLRHKPSIDELMAVAFGEHTRLFMEIDGVKLRLDKTGSMCCWNEFVMRRGQSEEVYRLTKEEDIRREYFFNDLFRQYNGDKLCFIEYIQALIGKRDLPSITELRGLGFGMRYAQSYSKKMEQILSQ